MNSGEQHSGAQQNYWDLVFYVYPLNLPEVNEIFQGQTSLI
jgi:hypothetical protein